MTTKRILITGATGFIGRHLVPQLERENQRLTLAVRTLEAAPRAWRESERISVVETGDIETSTNLDAAFADVSCVVHLAGLTNTRETAGKDMDERFHAANVAATRSLVNAAIAHGIETFVHLSSIFAVADNASSRTIDDNTESKPSSAYGQSKREAEACVKELAGSGIVSVSLRLPLVVGPDAKGNWASLQKLAATGLPLPVGSIRNRRSLIGIGSAVDAIAHLCTRRWPPGASGAYCVADAGPLSTADMVAELRRGMGLPPRIVRCPPPLLAAAASLMNQSRRASSLLESCEIDDTRFRRTFGYRQMQSLTEAIRQSGASILKPERPRGSERGR